MDFINIEQKKPNSQKHISIWFYIEKGQKWAKVNNSQYSYK